MQAIISMWQTFDARYQVSDELGMGSVASGKSTGRLEHEIFSLQIMEHLLVVQSMSFSLTRPCPSLIRR